MSKHGEPGQCRTQFSKERSESVVDDATLSPKQIVVNHRTTSSLTGTEMLQTDRREFIVRRPRHRVELDLSEMLASEVPESPASRKTRKQPYSLFCDDAETAQPSLVIVPSVYDTTEMIFAKPLGIILDTMALSALHRKHVDEVETDEALDEVDAALTPPRDYSLDTADSDGNELEPTPPETLDMPDTVRSSTEDIAKEYPASPEPDYNINSPDVDILGKNLVQMGLKVTLPSADSATVAASNFSRSSWTAERKASGARSGSADRATAHRSSEPSLTATPPSLVHHGSMKKAKSDRSHSRRKRPTPATEADSTQNEVKEPANRSDNSVTEQTSSSMPSQDQRVSEPKLELDGCVGFSAAASVTPESHLSSHSARHAERRSARRKKHSADEKHSMSMSKTKGLVFDVTLHRDKECGFGMNISGSPIGIEKLLPGGVAMKAGLHIGDKLQKINGIDVIKCHHDEVVAFLKAADPSVTLTIFRTSVASTDTLSRSTTMPAMPMPSSSSVAFTPGIDDLRISQPEKAPEQTDLQFKGQKFATLRQMHKMAVENLHSKKAELKKNSSQHLSNQFKHAQQTVDKLTRELTNLSSKSHDKMRNISPIGRLIIPDLTGMSRSPVAIPMSQSQSSTDIITMDDDESPEEIRHVDVLNVSTFGDFASLKASPAHLAVFLNYVITNSLDPAPVLYAVIVEDYNRGTNIRELVRWADEIHCSFLVAHAPLNLSINPDTGIVASVTKVLRKDRCDREKELRSLFLPSLHYLDGTINDMLTEFRSKRSLGLGNFYGDADLKDVMSSDDANRVVKKCLWKHFEQYYNQKDNMRSQALACALASFLKLNGGTDFSTIELELLDLCPSFNVKDRKAFWIKVNKKGYPVHGHLMFLFSSFSRRTCQVCQGDIWPSFDYGLHCNNCQLNVHKHCIDKLQQQVCSGTLARGNKEPVTLPRPGVTPEPTVVIEPKPVNGGTVTVTPSISTPEIMLTGRRSLEYRQSARGDPEYDIEPDLPSLDSFIPKDELKKMKPKERKRQEFINELLYTERVHVSKLKMLYKIFFWPMSQSTWIERKFTQLLFPNIEEVFDIHRRLNRDFMERKKEGPAVKNIADILLKHMSDSNGEAFMEACGKFCRDQLFALDQLRIHMLRETKLATFIQNKETNPLCGRQTLKDMLLCEMQRLTKYPLLIDGLLKNTQQDTVEYANLVRLQGISRTFLQYVNDEVREQESYRKTQSIQLRLDKKLIETSTHPVLVELTKGGLDLMSRRLVHDGNLKWRLNSSKQIDVYVALFADIILLMQPLEDKLVLRCQSTQVVAGREDTKFLHSPVVRIRDLLVRDNASDKCAFFLITAPKDAPSYSAQYDLVARSKDDRKRWFNFVADVIDMYKKQPNETILSRNSSLAAVLLNSDIPPGYDVIDSCEAFGDVLLTETPGRLIPPSDIADTEVIVHPASHIVQQKQRLSSVSLKRQMSSIHRTLSEKRRAIERMLSIHSDEDEDDAVFENVDEVDTKAVIEASMEQIRKFQQLVDRGSRRLRPTCEVVSPSSSFEEDANSSTDSPLTDLSTDGDGSLSSRPTSNKLRITLSTSQRSEINRQLQQHLDLLSVLETAAEEERDELLCCLVESQRKLDSLTERLNVSTTSCRRHDSYLSANSSLSLDGVGSVDSIV